MTEFPEQPISGAVQPVRAGPRFASWADDIAKARDRAGAIRQTLSADAPTERSAQEALEELRRTYDELSVAEEELRSQNEELERAHALLVADRARYRALFEQAPVSYLVTDAHGTIRDANVAAGKLLRRQASRLIGKPLVVLTRGPSRTVLRHMITRVGTDTDGVTAELEITTRTSKTIRAEVVATVARDLRGAIDEVRWLIVDLRRRKRRERVREHRAHELEALVEARTAELRQSQNLKDELIAAVSHELRTPLSAIGGYSEFLTMGLRGPLSDEQRTDVERIHRAYEHMARVVDDLLNYRKLAAGVMQFEIKDAPLSGEMQAVMELV
ncbi:MAG: histidine kinase dimerization/phospho-acceptor domain-containing protein, partial [Gemmatimonadaceae bacterium]